MIYELHGIQSNYFQSDKLICTSCDKEKLENIKATFETFQNYRKLYITVATYYKKRGVKA